MPDVTITNVSSEIVFVRDFYLTLQPGASTTFFRNSADLMRAVGLHQLADDGKVTFAVAYNSTEKATSFDDFPGKGILAAQGFGEVTGQSTVAAALEDIVGLTFDVTLPFAGRINAIMTAQTTITGAVPTTGAWAVNINGVDGTEMRRYIAAATDTGSLAVQAQSTLLAAGTYTVKGRHYRVAGTATVNTDLAQLSAAALVS